ncbi:VLRF1 family aeRF1-type release factor [Aquisalibacillus elongatus]|uniref:Protein required for attachment to host cells n=1 Tax=Aquisalibacillus elongatus TaxID=485577 RepID=A0A3N5AYH4_9BACI|nr:VLRF1 family aeRF1-type release factor [Aquisalibacillus elongatus]RPF50306.1 hypothetical protein EDC24_2741 [Aquisalibacillus elongatus]
MDLKKWINKLENYYTEKPNRVFTMYLNTDPADPANQGGEWRLHLKNGLNNFETYMKEDGDSDEKRNFWAVKEKVQNFMEENVQNLKKSVIIFATADEDVWLAEILQMPVKTEFYWEDEPRLEQLKELHESFPKTGIILTQKNQVKFIDAELGSVKETGVYELDLDTEDWRQHQGPHKADANLGSGGAKSSQKDELAERFSENRARWYKSIAPKLDKVAKNRDWDQIYLVGESDEVNDLESHMNKQIQDKINKNLLDQEETKVLNEVV